MNPIAKFIDTQKKIWFLKEHGWYRNLAGSYTDRRCMRVWTRREISKKSWEELVNKP